MCWKMRLFGICDHPDIIPERATLMPETEKPLPEPTLLDPLGALIYYLCVSEAKKKAGRVPSIQKISELLKGGDKPINPRIGLLWEDLLWLKENELLLSEHEPEAFVPRSLASHNVNSRIKNFVPGFKVTHSGWREILPSKIVDTPLTAVRLIALKDLHHFCQLQVPQKMLLEFLLKENLIPDAGDYYTFVEVVTRIKYVDVDLLIGEQFSQHDWDKHFHVGPSEIFAKQDMYLELRAMDYFPEQTPQNRQMCRMELRRRAEKLAGDKRR
jgi:hypothetical protein